MPNIDSSRPLLTDTVAGAEGAYPAGGATAAGDRVPLKLEYTPEELGYERGSRNLPKQVTLTDDQIEASVLRRLGLDVKDPADYKLIQQRLKTDGNPYARLETTGSNVATYNAKTGRYELNIGVERALYLKLKGRAQEAQAQLETDRRREKQANSTPSDTVAGNSNIDSAAAERRKLDQLFKDAQIIPSTFGTPSKLRDLKRVSVNLPDDGKEVTADRALLKYIQQRYGDGNLWGPDIQDIFALAKLRGVRVENLQVQAGAGGGRTAEFDISVENLLKLHHTYLGVQEKVNADIAIFEKVKEANELNRFVRGIFNGAWGSLKASWETITDPIGTLNNIREAVGVLLTLSPSDLKTIAANLANDGVEWAKNATSGEIAEKAGEIIGAAAVEIILGKGAGVALRALRGTKAFAAFISKTKAAADTFKQTVGKIPVPTPGLKVVTDTMGNRYLFPDFELTKLDDIIRPMRSVNDNVTSGETVARVAVTAAGQKALTQRALEHIFHGEINSKGKAVGFHYEGADMQAVNKTRVTRIIDPPDARGVYRAEVEVRGTRKLANSTFFPKAWSKNDVVNAINEAYTNKRLVPGQTNLYEGTSANGMTIRMYLNSDDTIATAFPIYGK